MSVPCIWAIYDVLFTESFGFRPSSIPDFNSSMQALAIGILIPLLSSIIPIQRALSQNMTDALQPRAQGQGILVTFTDNQSKNFLPKLLFGSISVIFGICIYYFLPLGLLMQNY